MDEMTFTFTCADCDEKFLGPALSDFSYGQFIMRSEESEATFLDALTDPVFEEVYAVVKADKRVKGLDNGKIQQQVFSIACDAAPSGKNFSINIPAKCPHCHSFKNKSREVLPSLKPWPLPLITHKTWAGMAEKQKLAAIDQEISRILASQVDY